MQGLLQVFSVKEMWLFCFIELVAVGSIIALIGIIPSFMVEKGMSPIQAGIFVSLITWTNLIGTLLGSWLSDRIGLRKVFIWPFLFANIPLLFLIPILWGWSLYLVWCLSGIMVGFAMPQLRSVIMEIKEIGPALSGSAFGGIFTFNRIGGFLMPWFTGLVMEAISAAAGVFLIASVTLIPPILVFYARETGHRVTGTTKIHSH